MSSRAKLLQRLAANYDEMFSSFYKAVADMQQAGSNVPNADRIKPAIKEEIAWAKKTFNGNNAWITWWLRWVRLCFEKMYAPELFKKDLAAVQKKSPEVKEADVPGGLMQLQSHHQDFTHFMGTSAPEIQGYRPTWQSITETSLDLKVIEREWQNARKSIVRPQEGDEILIQFPDGWAWWKLSRHRCDEESRAMGHCGNGGSHDTSQRILSLRQPKGKNEWEPHLTFILEGDGQLGEMKGRNNDKPVAKYHPYIIALLENPIVKGIVGGGYMPEHNFDIRDLPEEEREKLYEIKPALMPLSVYFKKFGADEHVVEVGLKWCQGNVTKAAKWDAERKAFIIDEFRGIQDLIEEKGDETAKWVSERIWGEEYLDVDSGMSREAEAKEVLGDLPGDQVEKIGRILAHEHADEINDWIDSKGEDPEDFEFGITDEDDIVSFSEYTGDDVFDALADAYTSGLERGTQDEMHKAIMSAVKGSPYVPSNLKDEYDSPWYELLPVADAIELIDEDAYIDNYREERGDEIEVSEPHNGFSNYSKEGALQRFTEEYDIDKEFTEAFGENAVQEFTEKKALQKQYKDEYRRIISSLRSALKDETPEQKAQVSEYLEEFDQGNYAPFVEWARTIIPDAFTFDKDPVEKTEQPKAAAARRVLYHGTARTFDNLHPNRYGIIWLGEKRIARSYAADDVFMVNSPDARARVIQVRLKPNANIVDLADLSNPAVAEYRKLVSAIQEKNEATGKYHFDRPTEESTSLIPDATWGKMADHNLIERYSRWAIPFFVEHGVDGLEVDDNTGRNDHRSVALLNPEAISTEKRAAKATQEPALSIEAAPNYLDMFNVLRPLIMGLGTEMGWDQGKRERQWNNLKAKYIDSEIAWAKKTFNGNSAWITWWLRLYRLTLARGWDGVDEHPTAEKLIADYNRQGGTNFTYDTVGLLDRSIPAIHGDLVHMMGTPCPTIPAYRPGYKPVGEVLRDLREIETEWQEEQQAKKRQVQPQEGDEILIDCGDGWAWWLLPREKCDAEGEAMGHCGNAGSPKNGDRILSLRRKIKGNWEPSLTFILRSDGLLSEMKGRNNSKPQPRYFPQIIQLLKNPIVKGIIGGGYKPENNFELTDLSDEEREDLYKVKPILMPLNDYYERFGVDQHVIEGVVAYFSSISNTWDDRRATWDAKSERFFTGDWADTQALIQDKGGSNAETLEELAGGPAYDYGTVRSDIYEVLEQAAVAAGYVPKETTRGHERWTFGMTLPAAIELTLANDPNPDDFYPIIKVRTELRKELEQQYYEELDEEEEESGSKTSSLSRVAYNDEAHHTDKYEYEGKWHPEETEEETKQRYNRSKEWNQSALAAMSLGKMTAKECREKKIYLTDGLSPEDFKPLPQHLYHVTTAASKVKQDGLMSRWELAMDGGPGLSGGSDHSISFTTDKALAETIYQSMLLAQKVAAGEITIPEMVAQAEKGTGATRPWIEDMRNSLGGDKDYLDYLMRGLKHTTGSLGSAPKDDGDGWEPDKNGYHWTGGDGMEHYIYWQRPYTPKEQAENRWRVFQNWLHGREQAGGPENPVFFCTDTAALAKVNPKDIAILEYRPVPGAMGVTPGGMAEWRVYSGKAVTLVGETRPPVKTAKAQSLLRAKLLLPSPQFAF